MKTLLVGAGGFLGAATRHAVGGLVYRYLPATFPSATLLINVSGCFLIGALAVLGEEKLILGSDGRLFWMVGVLGGYTTFSAFGYETVKLIREGSEALALANVLGNVILGLAAVWLGAASARVLA
jgi:CrcB protein